MQRQDKSTGVHARIHIHIPKGTYVYFVTYKGDDTVVSLSAGVSTCSIRIGVTKFVKIFVPSTVKPQTITRVTT